MGKKMNNLVRGVRGMDKEKFLDWIKSEMEHVSENDLNDSWWGGLFRSLESVKEEVETGRFDTSK